MACRLTEEVRTRLRALLDKEIWVEVTQRELADLVDVHEVTLGQWLKGGRVAQTQRAQDAARRLCRRVGVNPDEGLEPLSNRQAA